LYFDQIHVQMYNLMVKCWIYPEKFIFRIYATKPSASCRTGSCLKEE